MTAGPAGSYHEDCWTELQERATSPGLEQQLDYQRRIATGGLAALLSPYVTDVPEDREEAPSVGV